MEASEMLKKVRQEKPVVHHLTNWVTIYDCASIVKVFGASPVMAHAKEEVSDMVKIASSLVLNIGTLTPEFTDSMVKAALSAKEKGIPVVLDVCGAGATPLRDEKARELLDTKAISVIKGNASEIARVFGEDVQTKGVDSSEVDKNLLTLAKDLALKESACVVITGKEDIISDGSKTYIVSNGHPLMADIVGTGCMAASVIGAFTAVNSDLAEASAYGLSAYEVSAEIAAKKSNGPGTFKENLFDAVYNLDNDTFEKMKKIRKVE